MSVVRDTSRQVTTLVSKQDPRYPARLAAAADAPDTLYMWGGARGALPDGKPRVALVGARAASGQGMALARDLAHGVARHGGLVVSGGAVGIDAAAHAGALAGGGPTIVVLGSSLQDAYPPRNRPLFEAILERGGAVISQFANGSPVRGFNFPRRNRVIAGLAELVVVVEASLGSGSLYTAEAALDYGRPVAACPGSPGTEQLLARGAALVQSIDDVLLAAAGSPRRPDAWSPSRGTDEAMALGALSARNPRDAVTLGSLLGLETGRAARALTMLELEGLALPVPGGQYVRSALGERAAYGPAS